MLIDRSTSASNLSTSSSQSIVTSAVGISSVFREGGVGNKEGSGDECQGLVVIWGPWDEFRRHIGFITVSLYDGLDRAITN